MILIDTMNRLLIICRQQFGYLVDIYKWCEHISDDYQVDVVTFDGKDKIILDKPNVKVHYVSYKGNKTIRGIRYILVSLWYMLFFKGNIIVEYFNGCEIFKKILPWKKMILDIRTLSIKKVEKIRIEENNRIKSASNRYDFTTIISEGTRNAISLDINKSAIVPLGSDIISDKGKEYNTIRLLYVGTLSGREIDKTIKGLYLFLKNHPTVNITYDIVGDGYANEVETIRGLAKELSVEQYITLHGFKPHTEIKKFLDKCNIGISYVPITEFYNHQPPTKTYEYILSGLYTIATDTFCNRNIINKNNGILIKDNEEDFANALYQISNNYKTFNSDKIRKTLLHSTWKDIVKRELEPILKYNSN